MSEKNTGRDSDQSSISSSRLGSVRSKPSLLFRRVTASKVQPIVRLKLAKVKQQQQQQQQQQPQQQPQQQQSQQRQPAVLPTPRWALQYLKQNLPPNPTDAEKERLRQETIDPFLRNRPRKGVPKKVWMALPVILMLTWVLQFISIGIDAATQSWTLHGTVPLYYDYSLKAVFYVIFNPT